MLRHRCLISLMSCTILMCGALGCATFHSPFEKKMPKATAANPAVQIICLWQPGEGQDPEGRPCKGFSGQILFLSNRGALPVQIDGTVRVYLFDDQGTPEEQTKPLRIFEFDNGSWDVHLAKSSLGPTYSVFIPYTRRGVTDANCSLRVRLKPKQGPTVFSDFSNIALNGGKKSLKGDEAKPFSDEEMKRLATESMTSVLRRTTTISLGPDSQSSESIHEVKQPGVANPIQLASHEIQDKPAPTSADADRIKRLEAMVQQLLEQKTNSPTSPVTTVPAMIPEDSTLEQMSPPDEPRRLHQIRKRSDDERKAAPVSRRSHPLDDEPAPTDSFTTRRSPEVMPRSSAQQTEPNALPADASDEPEPYRRSSR